MLTGKMKTGSAGHWLPSETRWSGMISLSQRGLEQRPEGAGGGALKNL